MHTHKTPCIRTAWIFIAIFVAGIALLQTIPESNGNKQQEDSSGLVIMQLYSKHLLGVAAMTGQREEIATQARILDMGTIGQRQRYMAFMIILKDPEAAQQSALRLLKKQCSEECYIVSCEHQAGCSTIQ